ncbi:dienelactone hydrolase family protein [Microbacterium sp. YY-01]|uniref:dienelactone hydrolase family protein n=1 Tax=Microbacterium sp. YY-01 TaxID=3421634 RepID=UPI003D181F14
MCFPNDSRPPQFPGPRTAITRTNRTVVAHDGTVMDAVEARPSTAAPTVGVVVIHDGRGLHPYYGALAEELAASGFHCLAIDLYARTAGRLPRGDDFVSGEHSAQLQWRTVQHDLEAATALLRADNPNLPIAVIGFCLGGRLALLASTMAQLRLQGAVAFYAQTRGAARSDLPAPDQHIDAITCPTLSIFGGSDELIPAEEIAAWQAAVAQAQHPAHVVVYPGLGHSFF